MDFLLTSAETTNYDMCAFFDREVWSTYDVGTSVNFSYIMKITLSSVCNIRLMQDVVV